MIFLPDTDRISNIPLLRGLLRLYGGNDLQEMQEKNEFTRAPRT